jgi:uncharacterized protein (TIGR00255 family)
MRSMTGFGAGAAEVPSARITVEIRGVNQRHLDVRVLGAREFAAWEQPLRDRVRAQVARGRVDVTITRSPIASRRRYRVYVRDELAQAYVATARRLGRRLALDATVGVRELLALPDLLEVREVPTDSRREWPAVQRALGVALRAFDGQRRREGRALQADMRARLASIGATVGRVRRELPGAQRAAAERLRTRVTQLLAGGEIDVARLATEVAQHVDRGDVTEEIVRLETHLRALRTALRATGAVGKRIEFLLQEVQRELNTTGAKLADAAVVEGVLRAKEEVEKLREQVQNVE